MRIELEIGMNLRGAIETFCSECDNRYNLGNELSNAFGLNFGYMVDQLIKSHLKGELEEITIKIGRNKE